MRQAERAEVPELNLDREGRRPGLARGAHRRAAEAAAGRGAREHRAQPRPAASPRTTSRWRMASDAIVIGFNVRPDTQARELAEKRGRRHPPVPRDLRRDRRHQGGAVGHAEARAARDASSGAPRCAQTVPRAEARRDRRLATSASGDIQRDARARLVRDGVVVYEGRIGSLRRFKDDVREVRAGLRVRHRHRGLPGHQGGRPDRGLRGPRGRALHLAMLVALERFDLRIPGCALPQAEASRREDAHRRAPLDVQRERGRGRPSGPLAALRRSPWRRRARRGTTSARSCSEVERFVERVGRGGGDRGRAHVASSGCMT